MAAGDKRIFKAKSAVHGTTTIASCTHFRVPTGTVEKPDPGVAASPGMADVQVNDRFIHVEVFGADPSELMGLVEAAAANFVGTYVGEAGADKTITVKNVRFTTPPTSIEFPPKDDGGPVPRFSITGRALWGIADTWATMIAYG